MATRSASEVDYSIDLRELFQSPVKAMLPVLVSLPGWELASEDSIEAQQLSGAMTNIIFKCRLRVADEWVLIRIFGGDDSLFARKDEIRIFAAVAHAGLGPRLLASFGNGRVEEFLLDQNLSAAYMKTPKICACIGAAMACFHFTSLPRLPKSQTRMPRPIVWQRVRRWAKHVFGMCTPAEIAEYGLQDIQTEIEQLEQVMSQRYASWLGFCHNDLQYGNMLLHAATPWSLSQDKGRSAASFEAAIATESVAESQIDDDDDAQSLSGFSISGAVEGGSPRASASCLLTGYSNGLDDRECPDWDESAAEQPKSRLSIRLIDYEYAGYNPVAYDVANHWCEYGANYHTSTPHILDYSQLPDRHLQQILLRAYVNAVLAMQQHMHPPDAAGSHSRTAACDMISHELARSLKLKHSFKEEMLPIDGYRRTDSASKPDESVLSPAVTVSADAEDDSLPSICQKTRKLEGVVEQLRVAALAYIPISHLHWGLWGVMLARTSKVPDFEFETYARQRLAEYHRLKVEHLGCGPDYGLAQA